MSESESNNQSAEVDKIGSDYVEDGKNRHVVKCKYCGLKILDKKTALYVSEAKELPLMHQDAKKADLQNETIEDFYQVENMYTFENIGFTHTVGKYKYLSCADCDAGPVGYHDLETKHSYVAVPRILHES